MIKEVQILVAGQVQGVGFRAAVKRHALLFNIRGYVRNLLDGRVEICAQGSAEELDGFLKAVEQKPGLGTISSIETQPHALQDCFFGFDIR